MSVVVPIYKVEQWLRRCVDSLLNQTYPNVELILVNDGSPDGCPAIVDEYAAAHSNVVAIHQVNKGLGPARNAGIAAATGEFLSFVDSDDYVKPKFIERMVKRCLEVNADVCVCNFTFRFANGAKLAFPLMTWRRELTGDKAGQMALDLLTIPTFAWNKLYRRHLFTENEIEFPAIYYEDVATITQVLAHANRVAVTHKTLYYYCLRDSSITGKFTEKNLRDYLRAAGMIRDFIYDSGRWEEWSLAYLNFLLRAWFQIEASLLSQPGLGFDDRVHLMRTANRAFENLQVRPNRPRRLHPETPVIPDPDDAAEVS